MDGSPTKTCFIAMPISTPPELIARYGGDGDHFAHVLTELLIPAAERAGYRALAPSAVSDEVIHAKIIEQLQQADLVLFDLSTLNPNVMFELGLRTALNRPTRLICDEHTTLPFDTSLVHTQTYRSAIKAWELRDDIEALSEHLGAPDTLSDANSLWRYFGLVQRGEDARASVSDDPISARLELILDELKALTGRDGVRKEQPDDPAGIEAALLRAAASEGMTYVTVTRTGNRYVLDAGEIRYDDWSIADRCFKAVQKRFPHLQIEGTYSILE